jgi:hypothetical protein
MVLKNILVIDISSTYFNIVGNFGGIETRSIAAPILPYKALLSIGSLGENR